MPKRFVRWVPREHAAASLQAGLVSHNTSAMWIFDLTQAYRPGAAIARGSYLLAYTVDDTASINIQTREHLDFEDPGFGGEAQHPTKVIVKNNETGAYGLGKIRQKLTNMHCVTTYARKAEVASALELNIREVEAYKPPGGWPA